MRRPSRSISTLDGEEGMRLAVGGGADLVKGQIFGEHPIVWVMLSKSWPLLEAYQTHLVVSHPECIHVGSGREDRTRSKSELDPLQTSRKLGKSSGAYRLIVHCLRDGVDPIKW